jgi:hypothetical protein
MDVGVNVHGVLGAYASDGVEGDNWGIGPVLKSHLGALVLGCLIEQIVSKTGIGTGGPTRMVRRSCNTILSNEARPSQSVLGDRTGVGE